MAKRISEPIASWIDHKALTTYETAAAIHRECTEIFGAHGVGPVSVKTVWDRVRKARALQPPPDGEYEHLAEPWSLADASDPADVALMVSMITEMVDESAGSYPRISRGLARWMIRLRRVIGPSLPAGNVSYFATLYLRREWADEPTDDLDAFLAFAPWRSERATWVYLEACKKKKVTPLIGTIGLHPGSYSSDKQEATE